jgi:hypothetical protein
MADRWTFATCIIFMERLSTGDITVKVPITLTSCTKCATDR